ncbi:MAG: glycosyltransferase family 4 protein, partial [Verrucomicrobia bacterium]
KNPVLNLRYWTKTSRMLRVRDLPHVRLQVASEYVRQGLVENRFPTDRIDLVPLYSNPIDHPTPATSEPGLLLLPSRLVPAKGVHVALAALARIRELDWRCVIAGDGWQRPALERLVGELGLVDRVRFLGEIPPAELDAWYRRSRIVLFPVLRHEPFGLVGVEALAHGRPVVAFGGGGADEWLADGESAIRIGARDPAAFAAAIARLLGDPALWERLAAGALARHRHFEPDAYLDRLIASFARARQSRA